MPRRGEQAPVTPNETVSPSEAVAEVERAKISFAEYEARRAEVFADEELSPVQKATLLVELTNTVGGLNEHEFSELKENVRHELIPDLLGDNSYRNFGREIVTALKEGPIDLASPDASLLAELSPELRTEVLKRFADKKLLKFKQTKDNLSLTVGTAKNAISSLEMGDLDTARLVKRLYAKETPQVESLEDVKSLYRAHNDVRRVQEVRIQTDRPGARVLPINELRIGHQDGLSGFELVESVVKTLQKTPKEEQPSVILVTNLLQGDFAHSKSQQRGSLVPGMDNMGNQFKTAKMMLDLLRSTNIPVVLSLGPDDHRMAKDYTLDVVADLRKYDKGGDNHITYYNQNKLLQSDTFQQHKKFQVQYILPLCYHLGRPLRSAEKMALDTDGEITRSEYLMIYEHVVLQQPLHRAIGIDEALLKGLGEWFDNSVVVDDADLIFETAGEERLFRYRHVESFSPDTLSANHTDMVAKMLGNLGTNGYDLPDASMTGRGQEPIYLTHSNVPIVTLGGLTDPSESLNSSQMYRHITGDASLRANAMRKRLWTPTIDDFEIADNGDVIHRFINKDFLDKADSLPRTAVFELCDIQKGSPTARSDYFIKYLSYILETAERMPVALQWAGDMIHGHIYAGFSDESQAVGLIKIASQKLVLEEYLMKAFGHPDVPRALLDAVIDVLVQQGNHDEIQRKSVPNNNDSNIDYLLHIQRNIFDKPGEESKVRHNATFHTSTGTPVPTWMGTTHLGAYTIKTAHYHIERGVKGNTGGLPLFHPYQRAQGLGEEEKADILLGAHWHNEQAGMIGKKLVVIGGAWAERSQFEDMRGYEARMAGAVIFLGGGEPPEVRFVHAENLDSRKIKYGYFTPENLAAEGFRDDRNFDPKRHAQYSNDAWPKSALQKALKRIEREASQLVKYEAEIDNPNTYRKNGKPLKLNAATQRAFGFTAFKDL